TEASQRAGMAANLSALIPNNGYAHFLRAVELRGQGNIEAARLHYEKAVALDTNYNFTLPVVGDLALAAGDTMAALRAYEKARQLDPRDALSVASLADLYIVTGRVAEAEAAYRALTTLDPENPGAHYGLAFALLQMRRGLDAKPHLERSLALDPAQPAALNYLGMIEQATGNPGRARALYEAALGL